MGRNSTHPLGVVGAREADPLPRMAGHHKARSHVSTLPVNSLLRILLILTVGVVAERLACHSLRLRRHRTPANTEDFSNAVNSRPIATDIEKEFSPLEHMSKSRGISHRRGTTNCRSAL